MKNYDDIIIDCGGRDTVSLRAALAGCVIRHAIGTRGHVIGLSQWHQCSRDVCDVDLLAKMNGGIKRIQR